MKRRIIRDPVNGEPYLIRWSILPGLKVHRILRADHDRDLHDHPWWFVSLVLWGWYEEEIPTTFTVNGSAGFGYAPGDELYVSGQTHTRRIRWFNRKPAVGRHRIVKVSKHCWTLFINGPRVRQWGFHTEHGFVPEYAYAPEEA